MEKLGLVRTLLVTFTSGQFTNTMVGKFDGAMSLSPDSAVSNIDTFSSASLQLPSSWTHTGAIWEAVNPSSMSGTVTGSTRTLAHGLFRQPQQMAVW